MSASTMPTVRPALARASARLTVTDDLPTPPLPLAIAKTLVSEPGWANGISLAGLPPRSVVWSSARCSGVIAPRVSSTPVTPSTAPRALRTSRSMVSFIGQPETVSRTVTLHQARGVDLELVDHAELGDRPLDLGVVDGGEGLGEPVGAWGRS